MNEPAANIPQAPRRRWWPVVKWSLFAVVLVFVGRRVWGLWSAEGAALAEIELCPGWLAAAGAAYVAGWVPSIWFWRTTLKRLGYRTGRLDAARAYYCGHLGKYVPGKAMVLVIRAGLLRERGAASGPAALTAAYETLAMMAVGLATGVALAPFVLSNTVWERVPAPLDRLWELEWFRAIWSQPAVVLAIVVLVTLLSLPLFARLASKVAGSMVLLHERGTPTDRSIDTRFLGLGMVALVGGWWGLGLSLGCTLSAVSGTPLDLAEWPVWTAAVSLATSIGFVAIFAPGGVGVREWVLVETLRLQPAWSAAQAVAAALLLRVLWLAAEIVAAAVLYYGLRSRAPAAASGSSSSPTRTTA